MAYFGALTGLLVGIVAWPLSTLAARDFGMAVVPGTVSLLAEPIKLLMSWDVLFVVGIPLGGFVAARRSGPVTVSKVSAMSASKHFERTHPMSDMLNILRHPPAVFMGAIALTMGLDHASRWRPLTASARVQAARYV